MVVATEGQSNRNQLWQTKTTYIDSNSFYCLLLYTTGVGIMGFFESVFDSDGTNTKMKNITQEYGSLLLLFFLVFSIKH